MSIQCGNVSPLALNSCPMPIRIELKLPKNSICSPTYMFADSRPLPSRYLHRVPHIKHNNIIYPVDGRKQRNVCVIMCCHPRARPLPYMCQRVVIVAPTRASLCVPGMAPRGDTKNNNAQHLSPHCQHAKC